MSIYRSREITAKMKIKKLVWNRRKGNTWNRTITVEVNRKTGVEVRVFLHPKFSAGDGTSDGSSAEKAILFVTAEIKPVLRKQLVGYYKRCWVQIDTEVMDKYAGKRLHFVTGHPYPISIDEKENQVNFRQDLVSHDQLKSCKSKSVTLTMKVTFITSQNEKYEFSEDPVNEDGYFEVKKQEEV